MSKDLFGEKYVLTRPPMGSKRRAHLAKMWMRSGVGFGTAAAVASTFFFDWKYVLQYVPFINTKWKD